MSSRLLDWYAQRDGMPDWDENIAWLLGDTYDPELAWSQARDAFSDLLALATSDPPSEETTLLLVVTLEDAKDWSPVPELAELEALEHERPPILAAFPTRSKPPPTTGLVERPVKNSFFPDEPLPVVGMYRAWPSPWEGKDLYVRSFVFEAVAPGRGGDR